MLAEEQARNFERELQRLKKNSELDANRLQEEMENALTSVPISDM